METRLGLHCSDRRHKPMHPTADTKDFMFLHGAGRRGDWRRWAAHVISGKARDIRMKKTLLLMSTLASSLMLSSFVLAQSAAETESNRIRRVKGHDLISTYLPSIRI